MKHLNSLLTKSLFSATLLAMSAGANAQVFQKMDNVFMHTHRSAPSIADINNDGRMDIYYGGEQYSGKENPWGIDSWWPMGMVFTNQGDGTFTGLASTLHTGEGMEADGTFSAFGLPPTIWNTTRWIDFNNDGNLDFISTGKSGDGLDINQDTNGGCYTLLYKNGGAENGYKFALVPNTGLVQGVNEGNDWGGNANKSSFSFADYDHDGYVDILMQVMYKYKEGDEDKSKRVVALYKNNGDGTFTEQKVFKPIPYEDNPNPEGLFDIIVDENDPLNTQYIPKMIMRPATHGAVAMGDLNGDGWPDIVYTGWTDGDNGGGSFQIYKNNGDGTFTEVDLSDKNFIPVQESEIALADVNNDGLLDIISFGTDNVSDSKKHADIYINKGEGDFSFDLQTAAGGNGLYGASESQIRVCDLNHDGLVDVISTGWSNINDFNNWGLHVQYQNEDGTFSEQGRGDLPALFYNGGFELGHLLSSTSVDLFGTGEYSGTAANLFKNTDETTAEAPAAPTDVQASYAGGKLTVTWKGDEDNLGKSYNVYVKNKATGWISMLLPADTETGALKTIQDMQNAVRSDDPSEMSYTLNIPDADYEVGVSTVNPDAVCSAFAKAEHISTGIKNVSNNANADVKVVAVEGGVMAQGDGNAAVTVYNAAGQTIATGVTNKTIAVKAKGVVLVKVGSKTTKVVLK